MNEKSKETRRKCTNTREKMARKPANSETNVKDCWGQCESDFTTCCEELRRFLDNNSKEKIKLLHEKIDSMIEEKEAENEWIDVYDEDNEDFEDLDIGKLRETIEDWSFNSVILDGKMIREFYRCLGAIGFIIGKDKEQEAEITRAYELLEDLKNTYIIRAVEDIILG